MNMQSSSVITEEHVYDAMRECYDPEIPVDVVNLGLVYGITIVDDWVGVKMTLTSPGCPASNMIAQQAKDRLKKIRVSETRTCTSYGNPSGRRTG
jgi:metal-sulfur cluster biosynthetic enzyme